MEGNTSARKPLRISIQRASRWASRTSRCGTARSDVATTAWLAILFSLTQRRRDAKIFLWKTAHNTLDSIFHQRSTKIEEVTEP